MQDIWKLKKKQQNIAFGQGLFTLTKMAKQHEWEMVQMVRWACWSPLSSTDPNNIGQLWKSTCYV